MSALTVASMSRAMPAASSPAYAAISAEVLAPGVAVCLVIAVIAIWVRNLTGVAILPDDLDFTGMFHGVDERVPIDALVFGQQVLTDLLRTY